MTDRTITDREMDALIARTEHANTAWFQGDASGYLELNSRSDDFTLLGPFGGTPTLGFDSWNRQTSQVSRFFHGGTSKVELVRSYASGDLVVLVMIERQQGEVGPLPSQDWSLRVTQVYRREGDDWRVVHRHADPLVHGRDLDEVAALARGA